MNPSASWNAPPLGDSFEDTPPARISLTSIISRGGGCYDSGGEESQVGEPEVADTSFNPSLGRIFLCRRPLGGDAPGERVEPEERGKHEAG